MVHLRYFIQERGQQILDLFTELFGLKIAFIADDGTEIFALNKTRTMCRYCRMLQEELGLKDACIEFERKKHTEAAKTGETITYVCFAGLYESITPVITDYRHIGYLTIGQFRTPELRIPKTIEEKWDAMDSLDKLRLAYEETPCFEKKRAENIIKLFGLLVDYINQKRIIEIYEEDSLRALVDFMHEHSSEILELSEGARLVNQSPSSLSQKFKKIMGRSFKQYQIQVKLDKADELFRTRPEIRIGEVAAELGYQDPYYFSRLYKKHRGITPSEAKKAINNEKQV